MRKGQVSVGTARLASITNTVHVLDQTCSKYACFKDRHVPTMAQHMQTDVPGFNLLGDGGEASPQTLKLPPPQKFSQLQFKIMALRKLMPGSIDTDK